MSADDEGGAAGCGIAIFVACACWGFFFASWAFFGFTWTMVGLCGLGAALGLVVVVADRWLLS
ncbi:MAG: hypothetical protein GY871_04240 [Actinomycetales bacterium]|nr:hypothetical protein [Actinomycetales bacterium]